MDSAKQVSLNVRYLLWKDNRDKDPQTWPDLLLERLKTPYPRSQRLPWPDEQIVNFLKGQSASDQQIKELAEAFTLEEEDLRYGDFVADSGQDIFTENIRYLFNLSHGFKAKVAEELGVNKSTITGWAGGTRPQQETLKKITRYFGLSWEDDLETTPIFLSYEPVSDAARRQWIVERVKSLSPSELSEIFPALKKILE